MPSPVEWDVHYLREVFAIAKDFSKAERLKVGGLLTRDNRPLANGYNGMPAGWDNCCEIKEVQILVGGAPIEEAFWCSEAEASQYSKHQILDDRLVTKPEVSHAESNIIGYCAAEGIATRGATLYLTDTPCMPCCVLCNNARIKRIVYVRQYRDPASLAFCQKAGIELIGYAMQELDLK